MSLKKIYFFLHYLLKHLSYELTIAYFIVSQLWEKVNETIFISSRYHHK